MRPQRPDAMALQIADRDTRARLALALDTWPDWGMPLSKRPLIRALVAGGRTNINVRLATPDLEHDLRIRLNHPDSGQLGIDRERERAILAQVADADIGLAPCYWAADADFAVFPYLEGRAWTSDDVANEAQRKRLWPLIERLHGIKPSGPRRCYRDYLSRYWDQLDRRGLIDVELARAWHRFLPRLDSFDSALWPERLVHHDLVPANVLDTGDRLYLIDWEYAAPGHPDIDVWSIDASKLSEPFVAELMGWVNGLWERLMA